MSSRQAVLAKIAAIEAARVQSHVHLNIPKGRSNEQTSPVVRNRPPASKSGFEQIEHFEQNERLEHVCARCGALAFFGVGVSARGGKAGLWYCGPHYETSTVRGAL